MIKVGIVGIGFMGMVHYLCYQRIRGAKVAAVCEVDKRRLAGDWRSIRGNFGPPGEVMDLSGVARYRRLDDLIADPEIDLIDICLPTPLHAEVTLAALKAGKDVFCEKPIALSRSEARRMVKAARKAGRLLLIGHVLPFFPEYDFAYRAITVGKYGRMLGGHFKRIISDPLWLDDYWRPDGRGGPMLDLHVHDAHFIRLTCGMPRSVTSSGRMRGGLAEFFTSLFRFDNPELSVTATCGAIGQQGRSFVHGFEIHLQRATLVFEFAVIGDEPQSIMPLTVLPAGGKARRVELSAADPLDAFAAELKEAIKSVRTGGHSALLAGEAARDAIALCDAQTRSICNGRPVRIRASDNA